MQQKLLQKEQFKKTAETTGDLIGNKIADKITNLSKKSSTESHSKELQNENKIEILKKRQISPEERQITDELLIN